jgi:hypothetical protein
MFVAYQPFNLFGSISDKEFAASSSHVPATTVLIDTQPLGVLTEPEQIAPGLRKHSRQVGRHLMAFDRDLLVHDLMDLNSAVIIILSQTSRKDQGLGLQ